MIYNINFHIAALVFLLIILFHFMEQKTLDLANNRTFLWFMIVGFVNILFDLLCSCVEDEEKCTYSPRFLTVTLSKMLKREVIEWKLRNTEHF